MKINHKIPLGAKILVTLLAPAALYWQDLAIVANEALRSDLATHILAVPPLIAYILYRLRKSFAANTTEQPSPHTTGSLPVKEAAGILLCLLAYLIRWHGSYTFHPLEHHIASLPIFVAGTILIIFNPRTLRTLLFPIAFLAFLTPPPLEFAQQAGATLAGFSAQASYALLKAIGIPVTLQAQYGSPVIYLTPPTGATIPFAIDLACSGLYSLIGFIVFALFAAYISRGPIPKKIAVFSLGAPLIYALNIIRITLLVLIGYFLGPEQVLNAFHLLGGWTLILVGTLILLTVAEKAFKIQIFGKTPETCSHPKHDDESVYCRQCGKILNPPSVDITKRDAVKLAAILIVVASLLLIQVPVFALTQSAAEVFIKKPTGEEVSTKILPEFEGYTLRFVYRDRAFENISGQDASLMYQYMPEDWSNVPVWVGLEIGTTKASLHPWEVCLITYPQTHGYNVRVTQLDLRDTHLLENPPLPARYFAFQDKATGNIEVILYWYTNSIYKTEEGYQQKWTKISVIKYAQNPDEIIAIEAELLPIAKNIANYWEPLKKWSYIALTIAQNGPILITATAALLLTTTIAYIYIERRKRNDARHTYARITNPEDKHILDAVKALEKELANETNIAEKYLETTGREIDHERLHKKLLEAEESTLLQRKIININDEPYISWIPNF